MSTQATARVEVVGLGPAGPDLITAGTQSRIEQAEVCRLRTSRHPAAGTVEAPSFDHHYEQHDTFDEVYRAIVDDLVGLADRHGQVVYAVPGSPAVAEHTVELLRAEPNIDLVVHPALSFADLTWARLGVDPIAQGVCIVDGHRFSAHAQASTGPLLVSQCHDRDVLSDIKLAVDDADDLPVVVLQRLGLDDELVTEVAWHELDRVLEPDHLTSLYIPRLPAAIATSYSRFGALVQRLRVDCPWDAEQTHASLRRYLLEESYETLEALDHLVDTPADDPRISDRYRDVCEELGDLLYQVFFHAQLASEHGWFDAASVADGIHDKLYARHPHVFGGDSATKDDLARSWEASKVAEKGRSSVMEGIPAALPALLYATKVQKKAIAVGEPDLVPTAGPAVADEADLGDTLFRLVASARERGLDAESALRQRALAFADSIRALGH